MIPKSAFNLQSRVSWCQVNLVQQQHTTQVQIGLAIPPRCPHEH